MKMDDLLRAVEFFLGLLCCGLVILLPFGILLIYDAVRDDE